MRKEMTAMLQKPTEAFLNVKHILVLVESQHLSAMSSLSLISSFLLCNLLFSFVHTSYVIKHRDLFLLVLEGRQSSDQGTNAV